MKIDGEKIEGPNVETLIIPRGDGRKDITLKARAVLDFTDFENLCPEPKAPVIMLPGGEKKFDFKDKVYVARQTEFNEKQNAWLLIKSLEETPGLEWETIDLGDPSTWMNWEKELKKSGFSKIEIGRIVYLVNSANCISEIRMDEARQSFLAGLRELRDTQLSQKAELNGTQSTEPASDSESVLPVSAAPGTDATSGFGPV